MIPCQCLCQRSLETFSCNPAQLASASSSFVVNVIFPYLMGPKLHQRCKQTISEIWSHFTWHKRIRKSHLGIVTMYLVTFVPLLLASHPTSHLGRLVNANSIPLIPDFRNMVQVYASRIKCAHRTRNPGFCLSANFTTKNLELRAHRHSLVCVTKPALTS